MSKFSFYLKRKGWPLTHIVGYCPGKILSCPQCLSDKITIFFKPGFLGKKMNQWCELMDENKIKLCDDYKTILKNNYAPNWICKNCFNGGVIIR